MASQRISIGFQASPPIALRVSDEELEKFQENLGGEGWYVLEGEDGQVNMNLQHVLYLRTEKDDARVGFGLK